MSGRFPLLLNGSETSMPNILRTDAALISMDDLNALSPNTATEYEDAVFSASSTVSMGSAPSASRMDERTMAARKRMNMDEYALRGPSSAPQRPTRPSMTVMSWENSTLWPL